MHHPTHSPHRVVRFWTWLSAMILLVPFMVQAATAAPASDTHLDGAAQSANRSLHINVYDCPPGMQGSTPRELYDSCHTRGLAGVPVSISSVDGSFTMTRSTAQSSEGPGVVTATGLAAGDYTVSAQLPDDGSTYVVQCEDAKSPAEVPTSPKNASTFTTTIPADLDVICDLIVIPASDGTSAASLTMNVATCSRADLASDGRTRDDLKGACTKPSANPVTYTLTAPDGTTQTATLNANDTKLSWNNLPKGNLTLKSDVSHESNGEYVFCTIDGNNWYAKDAMNGSATFADVANEQISCEWYIVSAGPTANSTVSTNANTTGSASITVHAVTCDPSVSATADQSTLDASCTTPTQGAEFTLSQASANTSTRPVDQSGQTTFAAVQPGSWDLSSNVPLDTASFLVYCTKDGGLPYQKTASETGVITFSDVASEQIDCTWYFVPDGDSTDLFGTTAAATKTPIAAATKQPTATATATAAPKASMLVTLFACDPGVGTEGASFQDLDGTCTQTVDGVNFTVGAEGGQPISANTGESGSGAIRFYDLLPATYSMTPSLPADYSNTALFCQIGNGDVYQKPIVNGTTTFNDVEHEQIKCSWFIQKAAPTPTAQAQQKPTVGGSITVREMLCKGDKSTIKDWEKECQPGPTGSSYTLTTAAGESVSSGQPNAQGVSVFKGLKDGKYALTQNTGVWCKASAERVDSDSHLIVDGGNNTDVFLYQCNRVAKLPSTGSGVFDGKNTPMLIAAGSVPMLIAAAWLVQRRRHVAPVAMTARNEPYAVSTRLGRGVHRFR